MRANRVSACVFAAAAALAGCVGTAEVEYAGEVQVSSPELIAISPGAYVVADADEPLFYADGFYWLYRDGYWFRADSYRGGFARVDFSLVPRPIRVIDRPHLYAHYRRHMGRDIQARGTPAPTRPRPTYREPSPPPHQGVPSTPPPSTWQPGPPYQPGGVSPTVPQRTPPVTAPEDTQGTPLPPQPPDRPHGPRDPSAGPPPRPEERSPQARPDDRPPQSPEDRGPQARPEDRPVAPRQQPRETRPQDREPRGGQARRRQDTRRGAPARSMPRPRARDDIRRDDIRLEPETVVPQDRDDQATPPTPPGDRRVEERERTSEEKASSKPREKY